MKLRTKKEYFDLIKSNIKDVEFRDAHITFICEETGETLFRRVKDVTIISREMVPARYRKVLEDQNIIEFELF